MTAGAPRRRDGESGRGVTVRAATDRRAEPRPRSGLAAYTLGWLCAGAAIVGLVVTLTGG
jgi:hypothetical protein